MFAAPNTVSPFGASGQISFGQPQGQPNMQSGTAVKFNPVQGTDTMMKSGVTHNINTRHQCITCMKEYENKSLEELRCEDYLANRKGGQAGGNLFGSAPGNTQTSGGFFSNTPASTQNSLFGGQQKNLFGGTSTTGFGATATSSTPFGGGTTTFGASNTAGGGLFANKPTAFGAPNSTATSFGTFGAANNTASTNLFGNQQNKPMGFGTPATQTGTLFGQASGTSAFAPQNSAFGAPSTSSTGFGMSQPGTNLFGNQNKPTGFGAFGTNTSSSFGAFGSTGTGFNAGGASNTAGGGLFGNKPAAFGAPSSTSSGFGTFGATNTAGSTNLFGNQQNKPMGFGTPATQSGGVFGQTSGSSAFAPQSSAFGAPSTNTGGFGMSQPGSNPFGNQNKPTGFGGGFGTNTSSSFGANTSGFGSTFNAGGTNTFGASNTTGGGLFGNKPTGFGAPSSTTSGFGSFGATNTAGSTNLFGNQQNKPMGFGTPSTQTGTLFGPTSGTSAFAPQNSTFGAPNTFNTGFGMSQPNSNPFGNQNKPAGFGGFGTNTSSSFGANTGAFGSTFNTGGSTNMFGGGLNPLQPQQASNMAVASTSNPISQQLVHLSNFPYGENPLFKSLIDSGKQEEILKLINPVAQKALDANQYKVSPHRNIKAMAKPIQNSVNKSTIFDGLEDDDINPKNDLFVPRSSVKKLVLKPKNNTSAPSEMSKEPELNNSSIMSPKLDSTDNRSLDESLILPCIKARKDKPTNRANFHDDSIQVLNSQKNRVQDENAQQSGKSSEDTSEEGDDIPLHPGGITLKRPGYYTMPPIDEITTLIDENGDCNVENFTIGRKGYGNIFFPGITNLANMNLDEIVHIQHKQVNVYPDETIKPELNQGLNKKAQITLDQVWPVDKTTRNYIKDQEKLNLMNFEGKLRQNCVKNGATFIEYRIETGSWVFKVDHFSKYGLDESDDEDLNKPGKVNDPNKKLKTLELREAPRMTDVGKSQKSQPKEQQEEQPQMVVSELSQNQREKKSSSSKSNGQVQAPLVVDVDTEMDSSPLSPPVQQLAKIDASRNRVQLMKASLFNDLDENMEVTDGSQSQLNRQPVVLEARPTILEKRDPVIEDIAHSILTGSTSGKGLGGSFSLDQQPGTAVSNLLRTRFMTTGIPNQSQFMDQSSFNQSSILTSSHLSVPTYSLHKGYEKYMPLPSSGQGEKKKIVPPKFLSTLKQLKNSVLLDNLKCVADSGLHMSRTFRVGWGPNWMLANSGKPTNVFVTSTFRQVHLESLTVASYGKVDDQQLQSIESWLEVSLQNSDIAGHENENPLIEPKPGLDILHAHVSEATRQVSDTVSAEKSFGKALQETKNIWDLCLALWGRLKEQQIFQHTPDSHEVTMLRKEEVTKWLENSVDLTVKDIVKEARHGCDQVGEIGALLSGNKVEEACEVAQQNGDHFLALLMATGGGHNSMNGQQLLQQLQRWQEMRADEFISKDRLKLYATMAGIPVWHSSQGPVNICEDLDWKRAFGMHLWFLTSPMSSVADAFLAYDSAFQNGDKYAVPPNPEYNQRPGMKSESFDVKYHLLKLYTNRSHSLEYLLNPPTHTPDDLDFRLSWFLYQVLKSLGYHHMSAEKELDVHLSFASQLESFGIWDWAIYALLHITDSDLRKKHVMDVLGRNIRLNDDICASRELFLTDQLGLPSHWIAEAKAVRALAQRNYKDHAWFLIQAKQWNQAHKVIMKHIAPKAIINQEYDFLQTLLSKIADESVSDRILAWKSNGEVFYDFIKIDTEVKNVLEKRDEEMLKYRIEKMRPKITKLCQKISSLEVNTATERLCQSEIAKKAAHFMRAILSLDMDSEGKKHEASRILAQSLTELPLPDDYALQEIRSLTRSYMMEIIEY